MADAKITFSVEDWKAADEAFQRLSESAKGTRDALRETGESGIWLVDVFKDLGNSFVGRVAEGVLLRDAMREVLGGLKDVAEALPDLIEHTIEFGSKLYDMSLKTGASVEGLSALRYVAGQTGVDFESFGTALYKMEVALGSNGAKADELQKHLDKLHLNLTTLKNEKPDQAFIDIMAALEAMPNRADQAATGVAIFGKGFKDMAGLTHESIGEMIQQAKDLGLVMSTDTAAAADAAGDAFNRMKMQVEALGFHIAGAFVPAIAGLENDLSVGLNNAVKTLNASLAATGGDGGFLSTVAKAMGTGDEATKAQIRLYGELKDTLISLTRNTLEPLVTVTGFVMTEWSAAKVVFGDIMQIIDGDALAFEYLALGIAKTMQFLHAGDWSADIQRVNGNIDDLLVTMKKRGDELEKDKVAEREWGNWAVAANEAVEGALNAVAASHTDLAATIQKGADQSRAAYGGVGDAVEHGKEKVDKFKQALEDLNSVGTSWQTTLLLIDGETVNAVEYYLQAGVSANTLKEVYGLTEVQVRALEAAHKSYADALKAVRAIEESKNAFNLSELEKMGAAQARENKRALDDTVTSVNHTSLLWRQHYDFVDSRSLTSEEQKRRAIQLWFDDEVAKLRTDDGNWQRHYDALVITARDKMQQVTDAHDLTFQAVKHMQDDLTIGWQQHFADSLTKGNFSVAGFASAFEGIFNTMKQDVENIFASMLSSIIKGFLQPLLDNVTSVTSSISSMLIGALTGQGGGGGPMSWVSGGASTPTKSLLGGALGSIFGSGGSAVFSSVAASEAAGVAGATAAGMGVGIGGAGTGLAAGGGASTAAAGGGVMGGLGSVVSFLATNPIGWAIDAAIGVGLLWNHFSGPDDKELAGRAAVTQWEDDVWGGLSDAQRKEAAAAGWANPKDAGALIWMRQMYTNLHRPDPEKSAEAYMQNVWGAITKDRTGVISAIQDVQSFRFGGTVRGPSMDAPVAVVAHDGETFRTKAQEAALQSGNTALHEEIRGLRADLKDFFRFQPMLLKHAMRGA